MFELFKRRATVQSPAEPGTIPTAVPKGLTAPESAASLLATPRRRKLLEHIWERTSLSRQQFDKLYRIPLERYAELVQQLPASESHHHAYPGGMLDHGLEIVAYALKLRQSHLLPKGTTPEAQSAQAEAWTAAIAYGALLHDIGKIAVDLHIEHGDASIWHPWHGPLQQPYRMRYRKDREYRLHGAATGLLYTKVLDRHIFDWLSGYPDLWASLLYVLAGQYEHAGVIGELVTQADQASVAQELGGDPTKALAAPKHALQRKLLDGLRYLLKEEFKLNQPQASDGWLTGDALWLVSKTVSDKLRAHLLSQGIEGIPSSNTAVFNVLQDHAIAQPTTDGKAIWRALITSESGWSHSFTLLKLSPALIWEARERPPSFSGTVQVEQNDAATSKDLATEGAESYDPIVLPTLSESLPLNSAAPLANAGGHDSLDSLLDMLAPPQLAQAHQPHLMTEPLARKSNQAPPHQAAQQATPKQATSVEVGGEHFMQWLRHGISTKRVIINEARALVHTVDDTAYLVTPGVFHRYAQEHLQVALEAKAAEITDWQWVQKQFERLHAHRKQSSGLNIWACEVVGPRKSRRLHGYLLANPGLVFDQTLPNNPYLKLQDTSSSAESRAAT